MQNLGPYVIDNCSLYNLQDNMPLWNFPFPGASVVITKEVAGGLREALSNTNIGYRVVIYKTWKNQEQITFCSFFPHSNAPVSMWEKLRL